MGEGGYLPSTVSGKPKHTYWYFILITLIALKQITVHTSLTVQVVLQNTYHRVC